MADDEQFSLCWNNFNSNLSAGFHESLCRGDLVDVTLAAEGQLVKAHRLVLSVCSPYFRKMFTQMPANQHAFVFLKDVSHTALKDLIQFMYCGEVNVKQEALPAFISTAEALQIKGLTDSDPPASQSPAKPSSPAPQASPIPQIASPRGKHRASTSRSYNIETIDDVEETKQATQIVIQTTAPPQKAQPATIVQQQATQQQHYQPQQTASSTVATANVSHKRPAQRNSSIASSIKRTKSTIDPLEAADTTPTTQQITVQAVINEAKSSQQQNDTEFMDLPMELPTKSEPDYTEDTGEAESGEHEAAYVEDDSYGDMRYEENYFTENEDAGNTTAVSGNIGSVTTASTSKALVKQQYADSYAETSDQTNNEAQVKVLNKYLRNPRLKSLTPSNNKSPASNYFMKDNNKLLFDLKTIDNSKHVSPKTSAEKSFFSSSNATQQIVVKTAADNHQLLIIKKPRLKGVCVNCIKASKKMQSLPKIITYCSKCPRGEWMCEQCFDKLHNVE